MKLLARLLGTLWCLPATILVWLFYILPIWLVFKDIVFKKWDGPLIARFQVNLDDPTLEKWHMKLWTGWSGVGLPNAYIYRNDAENKWDDHFTEKICDHERRHCYQWMVLGITFPIVYLMGMIIGAVRGDPYMYNPLEKDARDSEREL